MSCPLSVFMGCMILSGQYRATAFRPLAKPKISAASVPMMRMQSSSKKIRSFSPKMLNVTGSGLSYFLFSIAAYSFHK